MTVDHSPKSLFIVGEFDIPFVAEHAVLDEPYGQENDAIFGIMGTEWNEVT